MHQDEQELLSVWEGWHWDDNKGGRLDPELCAKARREEVKYIRRHKMLCSRETGKAPIKTGWAETDKGQPGKTDVRASWVAKEYKTHDRPELYASTPPLEALKVVLSEIATGERKGKVLALVDVRRAYFNAPARRKSVCRIAARGLPAGVTKICVDCCDTACTAHVTPGIDAQRSRVDEEKRVPVRVERPHQGERHRGNCARRRHTNWWATVGSGVPHQDDIQKYEIKKQVFGRDLDLEKSGRILNRVIEWDRDGITIEADQRHVREIMASSWSERTTLPLHVMWKGEMRARGRTDADEDKPSTGGMT